MSHDYDALQVLAVETKSRRRDVARSPAGGVRSHLRGIGSDRWGAPSSNGKSGGPTYASFNPSTVDEIDVTTLHFAAARRQRPEAGAYREDRDPSGYLLHKRGAHAVVSLVG